MKINLYRNNFKTENYDIKELSLYNEAELMVLSDELRKFWKVTDVEGKKLYQIDTDKVKQAIENKEMQEIIDRSVELLNNIIDDTERMKTLENVTFDDFFFIIPTLSTEIYVYLSELKKK